LHQAAIGRAYDLWAGGRADLENVVVIHGKERSVHSRPEHARRTTSSASSGAATLLIALTPTSVLLAATVTNPACGNVYRSH
jgi:hypothetical protein